MGERVFSTAGRVISSPSASPSPSAIYRGRKPTNLPVSPWPHVTPRLHNRAS